MDTLFINMSVLKLQNATFKIISFLFILFVKTVTMF